MDKLWELLLDNKETASVILAQAVVSIFAIIAALKARKQKKLVAAGAGNVIEDLKDTLDVVTGAVQKLNAKRVKDAVKAVTKDNPRLKMVVDSSIDIARGIATREPFDVKEIAKDLIMIALTAKKEDVS